MNNRKIFLVIGAFWIILLGGFVAYKEFTIKTGSEVLLKTMPVDPRDLFRGDYVILSYNISTIDTSKLSFDTSFIGIGDKIFVNLNIGKDKIGSVSSISLQAPENGSFIKGSVKSISRNTVSIEYGIESYFVPEGRGKEIERYRGKMYVKVAIDKYGNSVIKSLLMDGKEIKFN